METFSDTPDKWSRFTCDCYSHILDISCYKLGEGEGESWVEITCLPIGYSEKGFWGRLQLAFYYVLGKKKGHSFWDFILRRQDLLAFKEFIRSLPDR
jgi:hypothetical protein